MEHRHNCAYAPGAFMEMTVEKDEEINNVLIQITNPGSDSYLTLDKEGVYQLIGHLVELSREMG